MCILVVPHNGSVFSKFLHLVNYLLESDVESESDGSVATRFRSAVDLWKVKRIPYKRGINGYSPRIKYRFRHMISSISSSPTHKNPELAAFHKPQQPLPFDLATHHKPSMATQGPASDFTAAIQPLLEDLALADPQPTFTLFPKLPPELRLKILKDALPVGHKGRRFIRVKARIGALSPRSKDPCWFIVDNNAYSPDVKDIGILGVNKEFRHVYLRHFDKTLKAKGVGLIRYHENDIIFICKYSSVRFRSLFLLATSSTICSSLEEIILTLCSR
jgi:hypothetical protein